MLSACSVSITAGDASCYGDCDGFASAMAVGVSPYSFIWSNGPTVSSINGLCAGTYYVTVTDAIWCEAIDSVVIGQPPPITTTMFSSTPYVCPGYCDGNALVTPSGGISPYSYLWSNQGTFFGIVGLCFGKYFVSITDSNGCITTDSIIIGLLQDPVADFFISPQSADICNTWDFTDNSVGGVGAVVQWDWTFYYHDGFSVLGTSTIQNPSFTFPAENGIYPVNLMVTTMGGCTHDTTLEVLIDAVPYGVGTGEDAIVCSGESVQLFAFGGDKYLWRPSDGLSDNTIADPWAFVEDDMVYYVAITASDSCIYIDSVQVKIDSSGRCDSLIIYNGFSPNDDWLNDTWIIDGIRNFKTNEVFIFNRWGNRVNYFENYNNKDIVWDGYSGGGHYLPDGTYYYLIKLPDKPPYKGWVQLTR